jgi:endonuclease/exonuclease/phosphatase family metal-dependent hydrolase
LGALAQEMAQLGYDSVVRLDKRSPCLIAAVSGLPSPDGIALFYKRTKLELDESWVADDVDAFKRKVIVARFLSRDTGDFIVIATTHLDSKKNEAGEVTRAKQTRMLLTDVEKAGYTVDKKPSAVFVLGDFNAIRGEKCHVRTRPRAHFCRH